MILGCAGCETTRATLACATLPTRLAEFRFEAPEALLAIRRPWTVRVEPAALTLVILGWDPWLTTMATLACATFPTRLAEFRFEAPEALLATMRPEMTTPPTILAVVETFNVVDEMKGIVSVSKLKTVFVALDVNPAATILVVYKVLATFELPATFRVVMMPTDVILGWAGCETTRATLAWATFPTRFAEFRFEAPEALLTIRRPWTVIEFPTEPTLVILGWDP